jgi:hypothetical protein
MTRSQLLVAAALAAGCIAAGDIAYAQAPVPPNAPGLTTRRLEFNNVTTNAPYSADFTSTVTQVLADGTRIQQSATGKVYRDSAGRMRREQQVLGMSALAPGTNPVAVVTITDPTTRTTYTINDSARSATKAPYARALEYELPLGWPGYVNWSAGPDGLTVRRQTGQLDALLRQVADLRLRVRTTVGLDALQDARQGGGRGGRTGGDATGAPSASVPESLGSRQMEGVTATGTRVTTTIPTGQIGNDRPIVITDETWDSPDLHTIVYSKHHDPRTGDIEYRLRNINRNEPAATLFQIPAGYNVIDPLGAALGGRGGGGRGLAPASPSAPRVPGQ